MEKPSSIFFGDNEEFELKFETDGESNYASVIYYGIRKSEVSFDRFINDGFHYEDDSIEVDDRLFREISDYELDVLDWEQKKIKKDLRM